MDELITVITGGAETLTPAFIARLLTVFLGLETVAGIIRSLVGGVR